MLELIQRGQDRGDIDATLPPAWLLTAGLALGRAAGEAVRAGRMTIEESAQAQAARATVRSEKDSSERSVARPVTHGGWVPQLAGSASCSLPGWRPGEPGCGGRS